MVQVDPWVFALENDGVARRAARKAVNRYSRTTTFDDAYQDALEILSGWDERDLPEGILFHRLYRDLQNRYAREDGRRRMLQPYGGVIEELDDTTGEVDLGKVPYWPTPSQQEIDRQSEQLAGPLHVFPGR